MRLRRAFSAVLIVVPLICCVPSAQRTRAADHEPATAPIVLRWVSAERDDPAANDSP